MNFGDVTIDEDPVSGHVSILYQGEIMLKASGDRVHEMVEAMVAIAQNVGAKALEIYVAGLLDGMWMVRNSASVQFVAEPPSRTLN